MIQLNFRFALIASIALSLSSLNAQEPQSQSSPTAAASPAAEVDSCNPGGPQVLKISPEVASDEDDNSWVISEGKTVGSAIQEEQIFAITVNCAIDPNSIAKNLYFEIEGIRSQVPVEVLKGEAREKFLCQAECAGEGNTVLVRSTQSFPNDKPVTLVWGKGIRSRSGFGTKEEIRYDFHVRPEFSIQLNCDETYADGSCNPYHPIYLTSSAKIADDQLWQVTLKPKAPNIKNGAAVWYPVSRSMQYNSTLGWYLEFRAPYPESLELKAELPAEISDVSGRSIEGLDEEPVSISTGEIPPLVKFPAPFGVLEANASPVLPITVRDVESSLRAVNDRRDYLPTGVGKLTDISGIVETLKRVKRISDKPEEQAASMLVPEAWERSSMEVKRPEGGKAFEVVGIPFKEPGFYVVEVESPSYGERFGGEGTSHFVSTAVLVTNMSVHFKWGRDSSLAWVTALDTGAVVPDADVQIYDCEGKSVWSGKTDSSGIAHIGVLPAMGDLPFEKCYRQKESEDEEYYSYDQFEAHLIVTATRGNDTSFLLSSWDKGIESWRYGIYPTYYSGSKDIATHTILSRNLMRRGETARMKHIFRQRIGDGFEIPSEDKLPKQARIRHIGSDDTIDLPLTWYNGTAETTWTIPSNAKLGTYNVELIPSTGYGIFTTSFSVEDYRVPLMRGYIKLPVNGNATPPSVTVDVGARYLNGGPATALPIKLRYTTSPKRYTFPGPFAGYVFGDEGGEQLHLEGRSNTEYEYYEGNTSSSTNQGVRSEEAKLDSAGGARVTLNNLPMVKAPSALNLELEFRDPNGEVQTVASQLPLLPSSYLVGMKLDGWADVKESFGFKVGVVNGLGKPQAQVPVQVRLYQKEVYTHRKKLLGGTYGYESATEERELGPLCAGITDKGGVLTCAVKIPLSGEFILEAIATDPRGAVSTSASSVWVANGDDWWFQQENSDRMDLIAEKRRYEPGETARFQVRMPFKQATALITVEREGILDSFVVPLSRANPILTLPIKPNYGPNVVVSALVVRGRVGEIQPTTIVDLGKPAFRLGMTQIQVGWKGYELQVEVKSDKPVYQAREQVHAQFKVQTPDGAPAPQGTELAVAVIDEGLLELRNNDTWQILKAMMDERSSTVRTSSSNMQVVGKRHFGLKALPFGGGGGRSMTRELFDTEVYWSARVKTAADGTASIDFPLNDSMTSFRIAAVATEGANRFGFGESSIRATKDLILFSGLPPVVREGDQLSGVVTVRNTTDRPVSADITGTGTYDAGSGAPINANFSGIALAPGESKTLSLNYSVPVGAQTITFDLAAATAGTVRDRLKVTERVQPAVPVTVQSATLHQLDQPISVNAALPKEAIAGRGGTAAILKSSLTSGLNGVIDYMRTYPFACLEQRISKSIALGDQGLWATLIGELPNYIDDRGLAKYFPTQSSGSDSLTAYLLSVSNELGWAIPESSFNRLASGLRGFVEGRISVRSYDSLSKNDLLTRKLAAAAALIRYKRIDESYALGLWTDPKELPTSALIDLYTIVSSVSPTPETTKRRQIVEQTLRNRIKFFGTIARFSTEASDGYWWQMVSNDVNMARFLLLALNKDSLPSFKKQLPQLMRGMIERQVRGHWDLTLANVWGSLAVKRFSEQFESTPVAGKTSLTQGSESQSIEWEKMTTGGEVTFPFPAQETPLKVSHQGTGKPWITIQTRAAVPRTTPLDNGYTIAKEIVAVEQKEPGKWHVGDVARVTLRISAAAERAWVVLDDPIPSGATILGAGLGRESALVQQDDSTSEDWSFTDPTFVERTFEAYRAYYEDLASGKHEASYTVRLNQAGRFHLPATRVEAMYSPEVNGEAPNLDFEVLE